MGVMALVLFLMSMSMSTSPEYQVFVKQYVSHPLLLLWAFLFPAVLAQGLGFWLLPKTGEYVDE